MLDKRTAKENICVLYVSCQIKVSHKYYNQLKKSVLVTEPIQWIMKIMIIIKGAYTNMLLSKGMNPKRLIKGIYSFDTQ